MRTRVALVAALAACLVLPGAAAASTAKVVIADSCAGNVACSKYGGGQPLSFVTYTAAPGEANRVVAARAGGEITLTDPAATITVEAPCRALGPNRASCPGATVAPTISRLVVDLGDGADTLSLGAGVGALTALDGGEGDDAIAGGGDEDLIDGGRGADTLSGGGGADLLTFAGRADGVTVDAASGRTSDGDTLEGFERIQGGDGPDRLLGGAGADVMSGAGGDDTLRGAGGGDTLDGDLGADRIDGGAGADLLDGDPEQGDDYYTPTIELSRDVLRGGPGDDTLEDTGGGNTLVGGPGDDGLTGGVDGDRLLGGSGADVLADAGGRDRFWGGSGRDRIAARDGRSDRVACGGGLDRARIDAKDRLRACERVLPRRYTSGR